MSSIAKKFTFNGKSKTTKGWAIALNINYNTLRHRIKKMGHVMALSTPPISRHPSTLTHKYCTDCNHWLFLSEFTNDRRKADGKSQYCRKCSSIRQRDNSMKIRYGITQKDFLKLSEKQGDRCAICNKKKKLCVDHNHVSGKIRGLLCIKCNAMLGHIETKKIDINKIKDYLNHSKKWPSNL